MYLLIKDGDQLLGMAIVVAHSRVLAECHNAVLPHVGWKKRMEIGRALFEMIWKSPVRRIIGKVPGDNRYARRTNEELGMELIGINHKSFLKRGELLDQYWYGISRPATEEN